MLKIYDRNKNCFVPKETFVNMIDFYGDKCSAITFVSSLNVIDDIVTKFDEFELINGSIEGDSKADVFKKFLNINKRIKQVEELSSDTYNRIIDKSYKAYVAKKKVIHTKLYIMENDLEYAIFVGSANFTNNGLYDGNHEYLELTTGIIGDGYYDNMIAMFEEIKNECEDFLSEDIIEKQGIERENLVESFINDVVVKAKGDEDFGEIRSAISKILKTDIETHIIEENKENEILDVLFTKSGGFRTRGVMEKKIKDYVTVSVSPNYVDQEEEDKWVWHDDSKSVVIDRELISEIDKPDVSPLPIIEIIDSYNENKHEDERHQVYTAFMYLFTSPYIWKIRDIYERSGKPIENIPIAMNILGVGGTGKSTLLKQYFGKILGYKNVYTFSQVSSNKGKRNIRAHGVNIMDGYYKSEWVKPLLVDEIPVNFYSTASGEELIKSWSNDRLGIHPTIITTSNTNSNILKPQLVRRMLLIPIDSSYKNNDEQAYQIEDLLSGLDIEIFINMAQRIQNRLNDICEEDRREILEDYLYIAKDEFNKYLHEFDVEYSELKNFYNNYNIIEMRGRSTWSSLLISNADNISINPINPDEIIIYSKAFSGEAKKLTAKSLLPGGVLKPSQGEDLVLDIRSLEEFVGYDISKVFENQSSTKQGMVIAEVVDKLVNNNKPKARRPWFGRTKE